MTKRFWFVNKTYGYGWTPATWEGWVVLGIYVAFIVSEVSNFPAGPDPVDIQVYPFLLRMLLASLLLIFICYLKGEKPSWRWKKK